MKKNLNIIVFILTYYLLLPFIQKIDKTHNLGLSYLDELLYLYIIWKYISLRKIKHDTSIYLILFMLYLFVSIYINTLPISHIIQIFLYLKFWIFFLYFYNLQFDDKLIILNKFNKVINVVFNLVVIFIVFEIMFPKIFPFLFGFDKENRGLFNFYLTSFFGHRTSFAQFIIFYFVFKFYYASIINKTNIKLNFNYMLSFLLIFLSYSRKEFVALLYFLFFFPYSNFSNKIKFLYALPIVVILSYGYLYNTMDDLMKDTFSEDYNRVTMIKVAEEILLDNLPLGTGPGTFGSQMSEKFMKIYDEYNVGKYMLGYVEGRSFIYDIFLISFFVEVGIGIVFLIIMLLKIYYLNKGNINIASYIVNFLLVSTILIGLISPVLMNSYGILVFSFIGTIVNLDENKLIIGTNKNKK
ncbi:MAG: hypothetical protein CMF23_11035 [Ignavibacteriae bacterium]|nr:hypothetical protein [Ignavibacteriota bacterium]